MACVDISIEQVDQTGRARRGRSQLCSLNGVASLYILETPDWILGVLDVFIHC